MTTAQFAPIFDGSTKILPFLRLPALPLVFMAFLASGCASPSPYMPAADGEGFAEQKLDESTYLVSFAGNALTSQKTVEIYTLYRAAEITLQSGKTHFRVIEQNTKAEARAFEPLRDFRQSTHRHSSYLIRPQKRSASLAVSKPIVSYVSQAKIEVSLDSGPSDGKRIFDARDVVREHGPSIELPN